MNVPQNSSRSVRARRAWAQPRFLLGAAVLTLAGATLASFAAPSKSAKAPVPMPLASTTTQGKSKSFSLSDLPGLVEQYGEARRVKAIAAATGATTITGGRNTRVVGTGETGFNLVETDLTPNSPSDERQPVISPGGDFIAFISNGADTDGDGAIDSLNARGKYHVWLMNRDGTGQRQLTGLNANLNGTTGDVNRSQYHPSWSPDGNQIVYADEDATTPGTTQLWVVQPLVDVDGGTAGTQVGLPEQRTYFGGKKESPAWSPSGLSIAFVTNADPTSGTALRTRDIFTISPEGTLSSVVRITGDATNDPIGNNTDDDHPAWGIVNSSVLFFSSDRDKNGRLATSAAGQRGRRIWRIFPDGTGANPVTDPLARTNGQLDDQDDFPAPSPVGSFEGGAGAGNTVAEQLAFQTNTYIDNSDQTDGARGRDLNVWSFPLNTRGFKPVAAQAEPRFYVSAFDSGKVVAFNTKTTQTSDTFAQLPVNISSLNKPESLAVAPGFNDDGDETDFVHVADRANNRIARFDGSNGAPAPGTAPGTGAPQYAFTDATVPEVSGLAIDGNYIYASSGGSTTALYRYSRFDGTPAGRAATPTNPAWSTGENSAGAVTSCESIAISRDPSRRWIAVSVLSGNKVNLYNRLTGDYIIDYVPSNQSGLSIPTGIAWGPDLNGDTFFDLYVCSSNTDQVKVFAGPDPSDPDASIGRGAFITNVVTDNNGAVTGLNAPENITIQDLDGNGKSELYVSCFRPVGSTSTGNIGGGTQVNRYEVDVASRTAVPWPSSATAPSPTATDAAYVVFPQNANGQFTATGPAGVAFDSAALAQATTTDPVLTPDESSNEATVLTNILSSPKNFTDSRLKAPQTVDRAADREPAYSRNTGTSQLLATVVFASGRKYSPNTTSNGSTAPVNPSGGDQFTSTGGANNVTHDIWSTSTQDTTPPALIPQGAGNLQTPVVAPDVSSPFVAPRTAESGLKANSPAGTSGAAGGLRFGVVLRDLESGLNERNLDITNTTVTAQSSVYVSFYNADTYRFPGYGTDSGTKESAVNDESVTVQRAHEERPLPVSIGGRTQFALNVYDDGPVASGGHEQQASAVAGDGNFYCEGFLPTPASSGDYYIDVTTRDRQDNSLLYDRVWGFSTRPFVHVTPPNQTPYDLFVSDYTCGQDFPNLIASAADDRRFANQPPVESYFLSNPGGQVVDGNGNVVDQSHAESFTNVDVWRILCRGPVPQTILNTYRPTKTPQIDPNSADKTKLTRNVAVSRTCVIWGAPYAGTAFVGPGTIVDPTTQERLRNFLGEGGRFFLSGREIAYALTSNGGQTNSFLQDQLGADFSNDNFSPGNNNQITAGSGEFLDGGGEPSFDGSPNFGGDYRNLRFPYRVNDPTQDWGDGAENLDQTGKRHSNEAPQGVAFPFDIISPKAPAGATLTTAYTYNGGVVGQRIEQTQANGLKSRVVFFSFGFESINRRYRKATTNDPRIIVDSRYRIANYILSYFKTGSVSGTIINNDTNAPIPGFLLQITGSGGTYLARTDANGNYSLTGLPFGGYSVQPYLTGGKTDPPGFFGGTTIGFGISLGAPDAKTINLRPIPTRPGAIIGKAIASNGTPNDTTDDFPIANLPVLVRSIDKLSVSNKPGTPPGYFVTRTTTDASGNFQVSNVPSGVPIQVIFNPNNFDPAKGDNQDFPASANINFQGRNDNYGRRVVPDTKRNAEILVPPNDTYYLNDVTNDTFADEKTPILVPVGPTISGIVSINGAPASGGGVELFKLNADGTRTAVTNPIQTTGAGGKTGTDGAYSFVDIRATTAGTKYVIRTTITRDNATLLREVTITLYQGQDLKYDLSFILATLTGKVLQNNQPVANVNVVLQNGDGSAFTVNGTVGRTAKTDATGTYTIPNVPVGGYTYDAARKIFVQVSLNATKSYNVFASLNNLTGNSGAFSVRATDKAVTVPTIQLINQQLSGTVYANYITPSGQTTRRVSGATVELLDANGNSLSPQRVTTSTSDGTYAFSGVAAGTYRAKASANGDTTTSDAFTAKAGASPAPNLILSYQSIYGNVVDASGAGVVGATVTLSQNGTALQTVTSGTNGAYVFQPVAAGSGYVASAVKGSASGSATSPTLPRGKLLGPLKVTIKSSPVVTTNPTSFVKGRTYSVSFPYETSSNATTRNLYERNRNDATIPLVDAFNYGPTLRNSSGTVVKTYYTVSRFNPNTLKYDLIPEDGVLVRGEGYLLNVTDTPANGATLRLAMPSDDASLQALSVGTPLNLQRFTISLVYNDSLAGQGLNGRNLIGFGFDPARFSSVVWDTTSTGTQAASTTPSQIIYNNQFYTVKDAAAAGLIYPSLTTVDGATGKTVNATGLSAFGGYFVTARKPGVRIRFQSPQPAN